MDPVCGLRPHLGKHRFSAWRIDNRPGGDRTTPVHHAPQPPTVSSVDDHQVTASMEKRRVTPGIMRISLMLGMCLLMAAPSLALDQPMRSLEDGSSLLLEIVTGYVERNYAGIPNKVTASDRQGYERHKAALLPRATTAISTLECDRLLVDYLEYFSDPHLSIVLDPAKAGTATGEGAIRERLANPPTRSVTESDVRSYLDGLAAG